eukprot:5286783-Prorocentrum_lima.AAC.1
MPSFSEEISGVFPPTGIPSGICSVIKKSPGSTCRCPLMIASTMNPMSWTTTHCILLVVVDA